MRFLETTVILIALSTIISCKKDKKDPDFVEPDRTGKIVISGIEYPTMETGNMVWTCANYKGEGGIVYSGTANKPEYGKYYTFSEMESVALPEGWRVPSEADFRELAKSVGIIFNNNSTVTNPEMIKKLASKTHWKNVPGDNSSGFNAYPGGYSVNNQPPLDGDLGEFWISDGKTFSIMESGNLSTHRILFYAKTNQPLDRFNLRFVKNADQGNIK